MNLVFPFSPHFDSFVQTPCASCFSLKRWSSSTILSASLPSRLVNPCSQKFNKLRKTHPSKLHLLNYSEERSAGLRAFALPAIEIKTRPIPKMIDLERQLPITMATANLASQGLKEKASHVLRKNRLLAPPLAGSG